MQTVKQSSAALSGMASPPEAPAIPLVDAPKPWLVQFILTANPTDYAALLLCCKAIRDLVQATVKLGLLRIRPGQTEPWPQLITACKPGVVVHLVAQGRQDGYRRRRALAWTMSPNDFEQRARDMECWDVNTQFLQQLCSKARAATEPCCTGVPPLFHITHLTLKGDIKGAIIPSYIALACPNLRSFTRPGSFKDLSSGPDGAPVCPHLHILHFTDIDTTAPSPADMKAAQQQLQLTTLKTLKLGDLHGNYLRSSWWARLLEPLHKQVTSLHLEGLWLVSPVGEELSSTWQAVRQVHLTGAVGPDDMRCLQQAVPNLAQLDVASFHGGDYSGCEGSWKQVQLSIHSPMTMNQLGRLPLSWVGSLRLSSLEITAYTKPEDVERARLHLANHKDTVSISKLPQPGRSPLQVSMEARCALLPAVVSVLQLLQPACLHVTMPAHTLLPPVPAHTVETVLVDSLSMCAVRPAKVLLPPGYSLFRELPRLQMLKLAFNGPDAVDGQQLLAVLETVCAEATCPAALRLPEEAAHQLLGKGWKVQLGAAMQAAGHQHVMLKG